MASEVNSSEVRASAFQSRLSIPDSCNLLVKCEDNLNAIVSSKSTNYTSPTINNNLRVPMTLNNSSGSSNTNNNNNTNSNNNNNNSNSPKMGSRRIFTPQFKLQVLESYRSDSDCKGNQRATARKYNIHRRQIQKWLQCESNLRSSVANINQNNVKHQFHNISHHHQQHQHQSHQPNQQLSSHSQPTQRMPMSIAAPSASLSGASNGYGHQQQHHLHHHPQVPLDAARQTLALNSLNVPSIASRVTSTTGSSSSSAQGVLAAANLAAAVAIASSSSPNTSTAAVSPLRPTAIGGTGGCGNTINNSVATSLLHSHHHHHHHHHFPLSRYTHSPVAAAPVPVSVPILSHHHIASSPQSHALHQPYSYHNLSSHAPLTHAHRLPPLSHQPSAFLPTACLPVNVLSAVAAASPPVNATNTIPTKATATAADMQENEIEEENCTNANANATFETKPFKATLQQRTTTTTTIGVPKAITTTTVPPLAGSTQNYLLDAGYDGMCRIVDSESMRDVVTCKKFLEQSASYRYGDHDISNASMISPIDLSLGSRRKVESNEYSEVSIGGGGALIRPLRYPDMVTDNIECHLWERSNNNNNYSNNNIATPTQVVDLTLRKRKVVAATAASSSTDIDTEQPQKLAKRLDDTSTYNEIIVAETSKIKVKTEEENIANAKQECTDDEEEEIEIEVEVDVEAKLMSSKPVKLFKPYLLDNDDDDDNNNCDESGKSNGKKLDSQAVLNEQREPIIWSNHPAFSYDGSRASSLHSPTGGGGSVGGNDKHTFHIGSPHFLASKPSSPQSVLSPTSMPSMSPTNFPLRCPKGSPVSGYESSSSICSDRDYTCSLNENGNYSLDFQMQTVCENKMTLQPSQPIPIRDWLNQDPNTDTNTPPLARASIALYV